MTTKVPQATKSQQGFIVRDHMDAQAEFIADMAALIKANKIVWEESVTDGLENAPSAFIGLFDGDNRSKPNENRQCQTSTFTQSKPLATAKLDWRRARRITVLSPTCSHLDHAGR